MLTVLTLILSLTTMTTMAAVDMMLPATENYNAARSFQLEAQELDEKASIQKNKFVLNSLKQKAKRNYESAIVQYKIALQKKSDFFQAYNGLGISLHGIGDYQASLAAFNQALEIKHDYPEALKNRGVTFLSLKYLNNAKATYILLEKRFHPDYAKELMMAMKVWVNKTEDHTSYSSNRKRLEFVNWLQALDNPPNQNFTQL
jgi:tetratricopeptide (TPR) repeat protein